MGKYTFQDVIRVLSRQNGEEKLRLAFKLSQFVKKLRAQGAIYGKEQQRRRAGTAA